MHNLSQIPSTKWPLIAATVLTLLINGMLNVIIISNEVQAWNLGMARTYEPWNANAYNFFNSLSSWQGDQIRTTWGAVHFRGKHFKTIQVNSNLPTIEMPRIDCDDYKLQWWLSQESFRYSSEAPRYDAQWFMSHIRWTKEFFHCFVIFCLKVHHW